MKRKSRLLAVLMALAMIVTFMPAATFAEGKGTDNDLSHYEIRANDIKEGDWRVFTDITSNITLDIDVVLRNDNNVVADPEKYDLKIIKETYTDTDTIEEECTNGQISLDENGTFTGKVFAKAKDGSGMTGETEEIFVDIFH